METRNFALNSRINQGGIKKMDTKLKQGPLVHRVALGSLLNKPLHQNRVLKNVEKPKISLKKYTKNVEDTENVFKGFEDVKKKEKHNLEEKMEVDEVIEELSDAFSSQMLNIEDIDAEDEEDQQLVSEYVNDIYKYMWMLEDSNKVQPNYLLGQRINFKMRAILIDWLVQVHLKFALLQETLFLTVAILDRYLQVTQTPKEQLQLVGVTAMFIASKYEEMYIPEIGDFSYITDKAFNNTDIRRMEVKMLKTLKIYISYPLPLHFLRRNSKAGHVNGVQHTLAKYLMELTLCDYYFCHYKPSEIAAAALFTSIKLLDCKKDWNPTLMHYSNYSEKDILPLVQKLASLVIKSPTVKQQAVREKYKSSRFMKIAELPELKPNSKILKKLSEGSI